MTARRNTKNASPRSLYSKLRKALDREWPTIRTVSALISILSLVALIVTVMISNRQTSLLTAQVADQLSRPVILSEATYLEEQPQDITELKQEMVDEYFTTIYELSYENPGVPFHELTSMMPPITRTYPPGNVGLRVRILNTGDSPATNLSVRISWASSLTSLDIIALSDWETVNGGEGYDSVLLSIQRLSMGETVEIIAHYAPPSQDFITISLTPYPVVHSSDPILDALNQALHSTDLPTFQTQRTSSAYSPNNIQITIVSDETPVLNFNPTERQPQLVTQEMISQVTVQAPGTLP